MSKGGKMTNHSFPEIVSYVSPDQVLHRLVMWEDAQKDTLPLDEAIALERLEEAGIKAAEREEKLDYLTLNGKRATPRVLASYPDLHSLDRLDQACNGFDLSHNMKAGNIRSVLQAAEVALLNIEELSGRIVKDIEQGRVGDAEEKYRWISSFQQTLHSLSLLCSKLPACGTGKQVSITHSPSFSAALDGLKFVHRVLKKAGFTEPQHIDTQDIHQSGRNLSHQAFVDTNYTDIWMNILKQVNIPDFQISAVEDETVFYKRFVGTDALYLAVNELDQRGDNFLRQFRAYHQMSEVLVGQANRLIVDSIKIVLSPEGSLIKATENMHIVMNMLEVMNQNVVPILRNLSVNKYQNIRGSLGITSGSHSPNIKHGLFSPLYELFVEAVKFRVMNLQPYKQEDLNVSIARIASDSTKDHVTYDQYTLLKQANELHLALKTWRDLHIQFVKTQIGLPPEGRTPTASISGSPNAMKSAHSMRHGAHGTHDVVLPIYETLLGKNFVAVSPFASVFRKIGKENFVDEMLSNTAKVVTERSEKVQNRVHGKEA
jgi:tryptophan 2,3-dioxygenase